MTTGLRPTGNGGPYSAESVLGGHALKMASGRTAVETLLPACECWVSYAEQLEPGSFCSPREVAG